MRCQIKVAAMLFCLLGTDFAWGQSYQQQTFPLYRGLFSAAGMYRMPAGNYASVVEPGPGLGLQFHWNPLFFNGFLLQFNAGLSDHKIINSDNSRYLLATGTLGPVFDLPLAWGSELHLSGGAGVQYSQLQLAKTGDSFSQILPYAEGSVRLNVPLGSSMYLFAQGAYGVAVDSQNQDNQPNQSLMAGISYRYDPDNFQAKDASLLKLQSWQPQRLFAARYSAYQEQSVGQFQIRNAGEQPLQNVRVFLNLPEYGGEKQLLQLDSMPAGSDAVDSILLTVSNKIVQVTGNESLQAELKLSYELDGSEQSIIENVEIPIYGRNSLSWSALANTGSFVTHTDPPVAEFARRSMAAYNKDKPAGVPPRIAQAMVVYNALSKSGLNYASDPDNAFAGKDAGELIDTVYFPRETLDRQSGDCDDLTVLTAAMLENIGIETALVAVPGHIFLMFNTDLPAVARRSLPFPSDHYIVLKGRLWIPIEATSMGKDFMAAWQEGVRDMNKWQDHPETEILTTRTAWSQSPPAEVDGYLDSPSIPGNIFSKKQNPFLVSSLKEWNRVGYQEPLAKLKARQKQDPQPAIAVQIGILHATFGEYPLAKKEFQALLEQDANYAPALVNMGNIEFSQRNYKAALPYYEQAIEVWPKSVELMVNLARTYFELQNYDAAKQYFDAAAADYPAIKQQFAYLGGEKQEGRAADPTQQAAPLWTQGAKFQGESDNEADSSVVDELF